MIYDIVEQVAISSNLFGRVFSRGTKVFGAIDSMDFVTFMVLLEEKLKVEPGLDKLELLNTGNFLGKDNPFATLGTIADMVEQIQNGIKKSSGIKCICTDLDGTLWFGVAGEENTIEPNIKLLYKLKEFHSFGVMLCLVTRNTKEITDDCFDKIMIPLYKDDFLIKKYEAIDKAEAILSISRELNIGIDSIAFIDDQEQERDRVRSALPDVVVFNGIYDILDYDCKAATEEDKKRNQMYVDEFRRKKDCAKYADYDDWLAGLEMKVTIVPINQSTDTACLDRINQLKKRTNQFNFTKALAYNYDRQYYFTLSDKFGDYGIIGYWSCFGLDVTYFCMSCRAIGKYIEAFIFDKLDDIELVCFDKTSKNEIAFKFMSGIAVFNDTYFKYISRHRFDGLYRDKLQKIFKA